LKGLVFDIQRYSIHDGPGIRTVVFLKGCPLRCLWCSNPESQKDSIELEFRSSLCEQHMLCFGICPHAAIHPDPKVDPPGKIDFQKCTLCGDCVRICPTGALHFIGQEMTTGQVFQEILKDISFFRKSWGGVTLSGGEPFAQPEFSLEILQRCYQRNIHTAVETSGQVNWDVLQKALPLTGLFLYDLKHLDPHTHLEYTAVPNELILSNLSRLVDSGANVILRIPLIPGFNMDEEHLQSVGDLAARLEIKEVHLMPFHQFGKDKYTRLCRPYLLGDQKGLQDTPEGRALLDQAVRLVGRPGLKVQVGG